VQMPNLTNMGPLANFLGKLVLQPTWLVHRSQSSNKTLLLLPNPLETPVQPLPDGQLGHLLLNDVLQFFAGQKFLELKSFADVDRPINQKFKIKKKFNTIKLS
jgi:hypothetical protein